MVTLPLVFIHFTLLSLPPLLLNVFFFFYILSGQVDSDILLCYVFLPTSNVPSFTSSLSRSAAFFLCFVPGFFASFFNIP